MTWFERPIPMAMRRRVMPRLRGFLMSATMQRSLLQALIIRRFYGMNRLAQLVHCLPAECVPVILQRFGASIGSGCDIEWGLTIHNALTGFDNLTVGDGCHVGKEVLLDLRALIQIGAESTLSMRVSLITHLDMGQAWQGNERYRPYARPVIVGRHVYIGASAIVLPGVTLGEGCVIAAGALVNHDVAPHTVVAGVPARLMREI